MTRTWTDPATNDAHSPSTQKRVGGSNFMSKAQKSSNVLSSGTITSPPSKFTYSQRKAIEKEEEEYSRMFQLFDDKPEIHYLNSREDDLLAASVYSDAISRSNTDRARTDAKKPRTSGYDFEALLKDKPL